MADDVTCAKLRENGAELALGVLSGRERAETVAHLEGCAECREYVEQLTLAGDRLIGLLPDREPPPGFESRVIRGLARAATAEEPHVRARPADRRGPYGRVRRARLRLASAVAAFAVACGLAGWGIATGVQELTAAPAPAVETEPVLVGDLLAPASGGARAVGEVYAHPGSPGWMFVTVALSGPHRSYTGTVRCFLERADGTSVRAGDFSLRNGRGSWGVAVSVAPSSVTGVRLTSFDGTVLATAGLQVGQVQTREA
ncbi:zf-HC2 domain-containing protein [Streptomyces sp. NPDC090108]|uniref:zf-HC2 domain-containing protein n=1 Tax=Streptomyces sp. NPDC090108 TaxID=3365947 RepID=UPI003820D432